MDQRDVLWGMYQEHCTQGRHHEEQRATMSNLVLALSGGVLGLMTLKDLSTDTWPLAVFLILLGLFGALFSAKHYERFCFHMTAASVHRAKLETLLPDSQLLELRRTAELQHAGTRPPLRRARLHLFWIGLHAAVALVGAVLGLVLWMRDGNA